MDCWAYRGWSLTGQSRALGSALGYLFPAPFLLVSLRRQDVRKHFCSAVPPWLDVSPYSNAAHKYGLKSMKHLARLGLCHSDGERPLMKSMTTDGNHQNKGLQLFPTDLSRKGKQILSELVQTQSKTYIDKFPDNIIILSFLQNWTNKNLKRKYRIKI